MKSAAFLVCLVALGLAVWFIVDAGNESHDEAQEAKPPPTPETAPIEAAHGPGESSDGTPPVLPGSESGGATKPMTVDEYLDSVMRKDRAESADPAPEPAKVERPDAKELLKQATVTLRLDDTSLLVAIASIAEQAGVPLVIPPEIQEEFKASTISLALESTPGDTALDLLLRLASPDLSYSVKDGKIVVHRTR